MKKSILCIALGLTATTVDAQCDTTYLSGNQLISTDTTLSGVYSISGNFTIEEGITVMVKPYSTGGCGTLKVIANNITIKGTINGDYAGYLGGNAGAGATNVTSSTGHTNSLVACEDKDNSGAVTVYGGGAGLVGNGSGAGNAGQNGTNGSGSKQVCGNTDDTYGMIGGAGGAGGGGGASYGGNGTAAQKGGNGSSMHTANNNNVSTAYPVVGGLGGNGGGTGAIVGTDNGYDIDLGSGGGGAGGGGRSYATGQNGTKGGNGGGLVILEASNNIDITANAVISVNGQNGLAGGNGGRGDATAKCCSDGCDDCGEATFSAGAGGGAGSGAGSGGGILIRASTAAISGTLKSNGGTGGAGGTGGIGTSCNYEGNLFCGASSVTTQSGANGGKGGDASGGRIKVFITSVSCNQVVPGVEIDGGGSAEDGTYSLVCNYTSIDEVEPLQFAVYPNPTKDFLTIDLINHSGEASKIRIYDTKGSLIEAIEFSGINMQLQTSSWEEGLYFLELENGNRKVTSKIVKQ